MFAQKSLKGKNCSPKRKGGMKIISTLTASSLEEKRISIPVSETLCIDIHNITLSN